MLSWPILLCTFVIPWPVFLGCSRSALPSLSASDQAVFSDDFESGSLAAWHDGIDPSRHRIVRDPSSAQSGSHYLAVTYPRGADGGWLTRFLPSRFDSLIVSFHVRLPADWEGGTKLVGVYGSPVGDRWAPFGKAGVCPTGADYFAAMLVTEPADNPGPLRFYTYYPEMAREPDGQTCWGRYGDGSETYPTPSPALERGRWHHVEFASRSMRQGGRMRVRCSGWTAVRRPPGSAFSFGDTAALKLTALQLSFSVTGGVPREPKLHVDNLVVTHQASPASAPLRPLPPLRPLSGPAYASVVDIHVLLGRRRILQRRRELELLEAASRKAHVAVVAVQRPVHPPPHHAVGR